ncbi:hypothetical protein [Martelella alba]|uniref:Uncharacterized protein n=1 Tax=Martelella alba TaxID=2590451 RepID=A0ABY2SQ17_9HYPH|nr:hypothetical protein [Martelella alba]TKI07407.1 hypothetical protein FCN80_05810 [Martelella alba]
MQFKRFTHLQTTYGQRDDGTDFKYGDGAMNLPATSHWIQKQYYSTRCTAGRKRRRLALGFNTPARAKKNYFIYESLKNSYGNGG